MKMKNISSAWRKQNINKWRMAWRKWRINIHQSMANGVINVNGKANVNKMA